MLEGNLMSRFLQRVAVVGLVFFTLSSAQGVVSRAQPVSEAQASCTTVQPGSDWVCVNGGWVPPDNPLATGAPGAPPNPPASCHTIQPASNWVCVNGGWLPPDSPLAHGAPAPTPTPPASCQTIQPASNWVCVNGGWLPPDNPLAHGAPAPTPTPPATCTSIQPASNWVCVNGGWLPPDNPLARGAPVPVPTPTIPPLLMINGAHVAGVRASLRAGEPQFQGALAALEAAANRALNVAPMSVMDKPVTPLSGDKHDYMSQAPYWWPNPSTPSGQPYISKDGQRNPEIDRITDRANLGRLDTAVSALGLAYYFTGREEYAQHAAELARVWFLDPATRMNPNLRFGQGIPGIAEGRAAGIIETRLLPDIIDGVILLQGSPAWTAADDNSLKEWMREFLTWLLESPLGRAEAVRANNQETWYDVQIVALALYTGETDVALRRLGGVPDDIAQEFEPDGRQPRELERTRAWDYSIFDLNAFLHLAELGERVGVDLWNYSTADGRSLRNGVDYLVPFATGEKLFPYQQITKFDPSALHPILRRAAVGWKEPKYRALAEQIGGGTSRLQLTVP
jgi:hypothetical protein